MEQQDRRDDGLGHAFSGGPTHVVGMKKKVKTIRHVLVFRLSADSYGPLRHPAKEKSRHHNQCANPDLVFS